MFNKEGKPPKIKPTPIDLALLEPLNEIILGKRKISDNFFIYKKNVFKVE